MQRRLTIALISTALLSILLVGFGVLAIAQGGARARAEGDVTRSLSIADNFLARSGRQSAEIQRLLVDSRTNFRLRSLAPVLVGDDGQLRPFVDGRRRGGLGGIGGNDPDGIPDLQLDDEQMAALEAGADVLIDQRGVVYGIQAIDLDPPPDRDVVHVAVVASQSITAVSQETVVWFLISSAIVLAAAAVGGALLARRFAGPIAGIQDATAAIAGGDLSVRVDAEGRDEVAELGRSVNRMAADLERSRALDRQFLMSVSHDLRTPLTAITGYAEALNDGAIQDPALAGRVIRSHADRLERLVADLLDLAKLDANRFQLSPRPFDLVVVAGRTVAGLAPQASQQGIVITRTAPGPIRVNADPDRAAQAIGNLVDNALKFATSSVTVSVERVGDLGSVSVVDDGPGIAEEDLPYIFDRLYTGKARPDREENSSGLGLAIVRELATAMGGSVTAGNTPDGGAKLSLHLPIDTGHGDDDQPVSPPQLAAPTPPPADLDGRPPGPQPLPEPTPSASGSRGLPMTSRPPHS